MSGLQSHAHFGPLDGWMRNCRIKEAVGSIATSKCPAGAAKRGEAWLPSRSSCLAIADQKQLRLPRRSSCLAGTATPD
eukprot:1141827-Pelagomonas_calceolata.AAC.2